MLYNVVCFWNEDYWMQRQIFEQQNDYYHAGGAVHFICLD
jgi:hypothetical protein